MIGASYSVFDGVELLRRSVEVLRECGVDYINVIWQKVSYFGQAAEAGTDSHLQDLLRCRLVDELHLYMPKYSGYPVFTSYATRLAKQDEVAKRNFGLRLARHAGCSHFLTVDADEFYVPKQFRAAVDFITGNQIDCSAAHILYYHLKPTHVLMGMGDEYVVPFLYDIRKWPDRWLTYNCSTFPIPQSDPTRRLATDPDTRRFHLFPHTELEMHHMHTIRSDLRKKYINSTSFRSSTLHRIRGVLQDLHELRGVYAGTITEVPNYFDIAIQTLDVGSFLVPQQPWYWPFLSCIVFFRSILMDPLQEKAYQ